MWLVQMLWYIMYEITFYPNWGVSNSDHRLSLTWFHQGWKGEGSSKINKALLHMFLQLVKKMGISTRLEKNMNTNSVILAKRQPKWLASLWAMGRGRAILPNQRETNYCLLDSRPGMFVAWPETKLASSNTFYVICTDNSTNKFQA